MVGVKKINQRGRATGISVMAMLLIGALCTFGGHLSCSLRQAIPYKMKASSSGKYHIAASSSSSSSSSLPKIDDDFQLALKESFGFFPDIPSREWKILKQRVKAIQPNTCDYCSPELGEEMKEVARIWFQNNYEPEFSCRFEQRVGNLGDGGKWFCDPHRYNDKEDCLVYSVGSNNDFSFEREVKKVLGNHCEIHTFDPDDYSEGAKEVGAIYHQWGISSESGTFTRKPRRKGRKPIERYLKTLRQTVEELGHVGRTIDIFKIDCEGCELDSWETWVDSSKVGVSLQQVLVELHPTDDANPKIAQPATTNFFQGMHKHGYVIFHKEPNLEQSGHLVEYAFLKLAMSFFE